MSEEYNDRNSLSEFLVQLVAELSKTQSQIEKDNLSYNVDGVTLELDIACTFTQPADRSAKVKPEFWVLRSGLTDAKEGPPSTRWSMQHLTLRLTPKLEDVHEGESQYVESIRLPPGQEDVK